jgi:hypothetical protein
MVTNNLVADFHIDFEKYLGGLEYTSLRDLKALRDFKIDDKTRSQFPLSKLVHPACSSTIN